jgi:acyl-CoA reductase-like NAD-dependent aldehyde dehydrogenase
MVPIEKTEPRTQRPGRQWIVNNGEAILAPEKRAPGYMMMHKVTRVEYKPVGVMGCIVPWNYPFHNVFNPLVANLFAGNALVIKVKNIPSPLAFFPSRTNLSNVVRV